MRVCLLYVIVTLLLATSVCSQSYDVIIVGSGSGGLVAAELLTRQSDLSVLLLKTGPLSLQTSGGSDSPAYTKSQGLARFDIPEEFDNVASNKINEQYRIDWIDTLYLRLGKLLGGCSSINDALYFRPPGSYVETSLWPFSAAQVTQSFQQIEQFFQIALCMRVAGVFSAPAAITTAPRDVNDATSDWFEDSYTTPMASPSLCWMYCTFACVRTLKLDRINNNGNSVLAGESRSPSCGWPKVWLLALCTLSALIDGSVVEQLAWRALPSDVIRLLHVHGPSGDGVSVMGPKQELAKLAALKDKFPGVLSSREDNNWVVNHHVRQHVFDTTAVFASFQHPQMKPFLNKKHPHDAISQYMTQNHTGPWAMPRPRAHRIRNSSS